jgi:hypothetical protein
MIFNYTKFLTLANNNELELGAINVNTSVDVVVVGV